MGLVFIILFYALLALFGYLSLLFFKKLDDFERIALSFPAGSAFYAIVVFIVSEFIGVKLSASVLSVLIVAMLSFAASLNLVLKTLKVPKFKRPESSFAAIVLALFIVAMSLHAFAVPIYKQDPYMYHLPFAKEIYETGHLPKDINPGVTRFEYAYPPYQYMMYAFTSFFNGSMTAVPAKILPLIFGLLLLALIYKLTRTFADSKASLFSVLLFLAIYYYSNMIAYSNTDITVAFYLVASVYFMLKIVKQPSLQNYMLFAVIASMAYWSKYTAIAPLLVLGSILAIHSFTASKKTLLAASLAVAMLLVAPHLIRNAIETGNPVYPALTSLLGGKGVTPWYEANILSLYLPKPFSTFNMDFLFKLSYILLPLTAALLFMKKNLQQKLLVAFALAYTLLWFLFLRNSSGGVPNVYRYLAPSVAALSAAAAPAFMLFLGQGLSRRMKTAFVIASLSAFLYISYLIVAGKDVIENAMLLVFVSAAVVFAITKINLRFASAAMLLALLVPSALSLLVYPGVYSHELFSDVTYRSSGHIPKWIDENLPQDAVILYLFEYAYLIPREIVPGDDPSVQPIFTGIPPEEALQVLKNRGITHIYSTNSFSGPFSFYRGNPVNATLTEPEFTLLYNETVDWQHEGVYRINYPD